MSLPPLNALRAFEAVARAGSFRAAAESLFVTQPAISHQVRHLEDWLGALLFDRGGRLPVLTPGARRWRAICRGHSKKSTPPAPAPGPRGNLMRWSSRRSPRWRSAG